MTLMTEGARVVPGQDPSAVLDALFVALEARARARLGPRWELRAGDLSARDGQLERRLHVRRGARLGADLCVRLGGGAIAIEPKPASRLLTTLQLGLMLPLGLVCAVLAFGHHAPLAFLPGRKVAAALGSGIGLIVGTVVVLAVHALLVRDLRPDREALLAALDELARELTASLGSGAR